MQSLIDLDLNCLIEMVSTSYA